MRAGLPAAYGGEQEVPERAVGAACVGEAGDDIGGG